MSPVHDLDSYEKIIQTIEPHSKLLRAWSLEGGISAGMTALEVEDPDGRPKRMIVRRHGEHRNKRSLQAAEDEFRLLKVTHSLDLATPKPYYLDTSGNVFSAPYLVIEYVEGKMDFSPANLDAYLVQFAEKLAKIHSIDISNPDLSFLPRREKGCLELGLRHPNGPFDGATIRQGLTLRQSLRQMNKSALLHGDYWPGNTLWLDGKLVAVVDWEDAELGDPLIDLAKSRSELVWIFGIEAMNAFTRYYRATTVVDTGNLPYWDLCAALRLVRFFGSDLVEKASFFAAFGRSDINEQTIRDNYRYFIDQALDALGAR